MARPKLHKSPKKLNISIDNDTKRKAFALATRDGVSISALVASLIEKAAVGAVLLILVGACVLWAESRTSAAPISFAPASFAMGLTK